MPPTADHRGAADPLHWFRYGPHELDPTLVGDLLALAQAEGRRRGFSVLSDQRVLELGRAADGDARSGLVALVAGRPEEGGPLVAGAVLSATRAGAVAELVGPTTHHGALFLQVLTIAADHNLPLSVWAFGASAEELAALSDRGLHLVRTIHQLRCPLPLAHREAAADDGVTIRGMRPGADDAEWLRVNNAAFDTHPEQRAWTEAMLVERMAQPWFDPEGVRLAVEDGRLLGSCWTKIHRDSDPPLGEIYVIGVDPSAQGRGLGRRLTKAGLDWLCEQGLTTGMLYVEADNVAAVSLYRSMGFTLHHDDSCFATGSR